MGPRAVLQLERRRLVHRVDEGVGLAIVLLAHPAGDAAQDLVVDLRDQVPLKEHVLVHRGPRLLRIVPQVLVDFVRLLAHGTHALPNIWTVFLAAQPSSDRATIIWVTRTQTAESRSA